MSTFPMSLAAGLLASAVTLSSPLMAQSQWTDLGCALAGGAGDPLLTGSGDLTPGSPNLVALSNAEPSALSLLFLGLEEAAIPFKGGVLKPVPAFDLPLTLTTGSGTLDLPFVWPLDLPGSLPFYVQCAIQDRDALNGVALSNALRGVSAGSVPIIDEVSPAFVAAGSELTVQGVNLSTDPLDVLTQLVLPGDVVVGHLATQTSDGNTATADVRHIMSGTTTAQVAVGNGEGSTFMPTSQPQGFVLENGGARLWRGLPEDIQVSEQFLAVGSADPGLPPNCLEYPGYANSLDWLEVEIPALVCEPGTTVSFFMWAYTTGGLYCNWFEATLTSTGDGQAGDCAAAIGQVISGGFFSAFNKVIIPQVEVTGEDALLKLPPPLDEDWVIGSSSSVLVVCQPETPGCTTVSGGIDGGSGNIITGLPSSIPDDASATWTFDAELDSGPIYSLTGSVSLSGSLQPIDVANAVQADMQTALIGAGSLASALAIPLGGGDAEIQVWAPFGDSWDSGSLEIEICE